MIALYDDSGLFKRSIFTLTGHDEDFLQQMRRATVCLFDVLIEGDLGRIYFKISGQGEKDRLREKVVNLPNDRTFVV